jgi:hypothetical protein
MCFMRGVFGVNLMGWNKTPACGGCLQMDSGRLQGYRGLLRRDSGLLQGGSGLL